MSLEIGLCSAAVVSGYLVVKSFVASTPKQKQHSLSFDDLSSLDASFAPVHSTEPEEEPSELICEAGGVEVDRHAAAPRFLRPLASTSVFSRGKRSAAGLATVALLAAIGVFVMAPAPRLLSADAPAAGLNDDPAERPKGVANAAAFAAESPPALNASAAPQLPQIKATAAADEALQERAAPAESPMLAVSDVGQDAPVMPGEILRVPLRRQQMEMAGSGTGGAPKYHRSAYFGTLSIGTPAQKFTAVFDTGSGHLVLPSGYCHSDTCKAHARFRRSTSKSAKDIDSDGSEVAPGAPRDQITVSFGTGQVTGVFVEDVVCFGSAGAVASNSQSLDSVVSADTALPKECLQLRFIAATAMSEHPFKSFHFDGVMGLGLSGLSQTPEFNFLNVFARTAESWGSTMSQTFGVFLADVTDDTSEIALGGWNQERISGGLAWNRVHRPELGHWMINIKSLRVDGHTVDFCSDGTCRAVVDTGTSLVAVPSAVFPELYEHLRHPAPKLGHCKGPGPTLHIELEGLTLTLGPREISQLERVTPPEARLREGPAAPVDPNARMDMRCKPVLMTMDLPAPIGPKLFILGEPVLRKYYTVYDAKAKRVAFGISAHRARASQQLEELELLGGRRPTSMFDVFRQKRALR